MDTTDNQVRDAVRQEIQMFIQHMKDTAVPGVTIDDWIRDGMDWYLSQ